MGFRNLNKIFFFLIIILTGCKYITKIPIKNHDVNGFFDFSLDVHEIYGDELDYIIIIGWIDKDLYVYKNIEINNDNQNKNILMNAELSIFNKSGSRNFNIKIPIEKKINKVYFGNNELIWERKPIEILNNREKLLELKKYTHYDDIVIHFGKPDNNLEGYPVYYYTLNNNRRAVLNFINGDGRLLKLMEEIFKEDEDRIQNIIFDD